MRSKDNTDQDIMQEILQMTSGNQISASCGIFTYRGRVALSLMLRSLGIGKGDQVVIQAYTCEAVPEAILSTGAEPVFCDVCQRSFAISPNSLSKVINKKTKAVILQHTFGVLSQQVNEITEICSSFNIPLIEDCCHILADDIERTGVGRLGLASFFSFEWGKPIVAGFGGALLVNDESMRHVAKKNYEQMSQLRPSLGPVIQYLAFRLTNFAYLKSYVRRLYRFSVKRKLVQGNFSKFDPSYSEYNLKMSRFNEFILRRKLKKKQSQKVSEKLLERAVFRRWLSADVLQSTSTLFRLPFYFNNKARAFEIAEKMHLDASEWYVSVVHPTQAKDELRQWGYFGGCPNAEELSTKVIHFRLPHSLAGQKKIQRFIQECERLGYLDKPPS